MNGNNMNTTLLNAVDALINDDEDSSVDFLKQAMVDKLRQRMGINESSQSELEQTLNQDEQTLFKKFIVDFFMFQYDLEIESLEDELFDIEEGDEDELDVLESELDSVFDNVYDVLGDAIYTDGFEYLKSNNYTSSFKEWFKQNIVNQNINIQKQIQTTIIPKYHDDIIRSLEKNKKFEKRINKLYKSINKMRIDD